MKIFNPKLDTSLLILKFFSPFLFQYPPMFQFFSLTLVATFVLFIWLWLNQLFNFLALSIIMLNWFICPIEQHKGPSTFIFSFHFPISTKASKFSPKWNWGKNSQLAHHSRFEPRTKYPWSKDYTTEPLPTHVFQYFFPT